MISIWLIENIFQCRLDIFFHFIRCGILIVVF